MTEVSWAIISIIIIQCDAFLKVNPSFYGESIPSIIALWKKGGHCADLEQNKWAQPIEDSLVGRSSQQQIIRGHQYRN